MFLKKMSENKPITITYFSNGVLKTYKGRIHRLNLLDQILLLKDEQHKVFSVHLSRINSIK
ncbi:YolD-like family protein [Bacillus sp. MRMR6]|uniref:YolD-like family protein n=1 Tax=Bacillus sp. MRMR6 TaxID=1928617 RepID=UPI000951A68E|nr:YolD-like family protein [Bacillus sp. MRMR6]OLS38486.1 hypothetical protein BTR25_13765 [Bacillus sp. MRMR6]